jgi:hypothetical protein
MFRILLGNEHKKLQAIVVVEKKATEPKNENRKNSAPIF